MSFASDIRKFAEKAKRGYAEVATESLINLSASIIIKTPVDEATLVNSWQPSTDTPSDSTVEFSSATVQMSEIEDKVGLSIGAGFYYLVNNQPYAKRIEFEGHSDKAPAGMVRISIENYQKFIDNAISQLD